MNVSSSFDWRYSASRFRAVGGQTMRWGGGGLLVDCGSTCRLGLFCVTGTISSLDKQNKRIHKLFEFHLWILNVHFLRGGETNSPRRLKAQCPNP